MTTTQVEAIFSSKKLTVTRLPMFAKISFNSGMIQDSLSKESIKQFKEIYKKEFHEDIDEATVRVLARRLLRLYRAVYSPQIEKHDNEKL